MLSSWFAARAADPVMASMRAQRRRAIRTRNPPKIAQQPSSISPRDDLGVGVCSGCSGVVHGDRGRGLAFRRGSTRRAQPGRWFSGCSLCWPSSKQISRACWQRFEIGIRDATPVFCLSLTIQPASRSTSSHRRLSRSDRGRPVSKAIVNSSRLRRKSLSGSRSKALRNESRSARVNASRFFSRNRLGNAGQRTRIPLRTARRRTFRSVLRTPLT
jgi:hypothetical protein